MQSLAKERKKLIKVNNTTSFAVSLTHAHVTPRASTLSLASYASRIIQGRDSSVQRSPHSGRRWRNVLAESQKSATELFPSSAPPASTPARERDDDDDTTKMSNNAVDADVIDLELDDELFNNSPAASPAA